MAQSLCCAVSLAGGPGALGLVERRNKAIAPYGFRNLPRVNDSLSAATINEELPTGEAAGACGGRGNALTPTWSHDNP